MTTSPAHQQLKKAYYRGHTTSNKENQRTCNGIFIETLTVEGMEIFGFFVVGSSPYYRRFLQPLNPAARIGASPLRKYRGNHDFNTKKFRTCNRE